MGCEYECYCDACHRMVTWNGDDHDGNSCPNCGKEWIRPLPKPEKWLVEALAAQTRANERDARRINIIFALVGPLFIALAVILATRWC